MKIRIALLSLLFLPSCISMSAHQKELRDARNEELNHAEKWVRDIAAGTIEAKDAVYLIEYRRERVGR